MPQSCRTHTHPYTHTQAVPQQSPHTRNYTHTHNTHSEAFWLPLAGLFIPHTTVSSDSRVPALLLFQRCVWRCPCLEGVVVLAITLSSMPAKLSLSLIFIPLSLPLSLSFSLCLSFVISLLLSVPFPKTGDAADKRLLKLGDILK